MGHDDFELDNSGVFDDLDMFSDAPSTRRQVLSSRFRNSYTARSYLPRCPVLSFSKDGDNISAWPLAKTDTAGIAARVRAIDDAFFLEEFSSKALAFASRDRFSTVQPITWRARPDASKRRISSPSAASDSIQSGSDVDSGSSRQSLTSTSLQTHPGSPILTLSADELSDPGTEPSRSTSYNTDISPPLALYDTTQQSRNNHLSNTSRTSSERNRSCLPARKKPGLTQQRPDSYFGVGSLRPKACSDKDSLTHGDFPASIPPPAAGIPRRISNGIRRVLGKRDPVTSGNANSVCFVEEDTDGGNIVDEYPGSLSTKVIEFPSKRNTYDHCFLTPDLHVISIPRRSSDALLLPENRSVLLNLGSDSRNKPQVTNDEDDFRDSDNERIYGAGVPKSDSLIFTRASESPGVSGNTSDPVNHHNEPVRPSLLGRLAFHEIVRFQSQEETSSYSLNIAGCRKKHFRWTGRFRENSRRICPNESSGRLKDDYITFSAATSCTSARGKFRWWI